MTRDEARAMAALMLAYADGKTIQVEVGGTWETLTEPTFDGPPSEYRIKPEPKEVWVNEYFIGGNAYTSYEAAVAGSCHATRVAVHYREVCDE